MQKKNLMKGLAGLTALVALGAGAGLATMASAQTTTPAAPASTTKPAHPDWKGKMGSMMRGKMMPHGDMGKVTAINGSTVTLTERDNTSKTVEVKVGDMVSVFDPSTLPAKAN